MLPDEAEIKFRQIGVIDNGIDGRDEYLILTRFDGEGRRAMLVAIDAHEQQIALLGQALVTDALLTVMDMRANRHVHQVKTL